MPRRLLPLLAGLAVLGAGCRGMTAYHSPPQLVPVTPSGSVWYGTMHAGQAPTYYHKATP